VQGKTGSLEKKRARKWQRCGPQRLRHPNTPLEKGGAKVYLSSVLQSLAKKAWVETREESFQDSPQLSEGRGGRRENP